MSAARIEGEIAANCADRLTGRIGSEIESVRSGSDADIGIDHSRLYAGCPIVGIKFEDLIELV